MTVTIDSNLSSNFYNLQFCVGEANGVPVININLDDPKEILEHSPMVGLDNSLKRLVTNQLQYFFCYLDLQSNLCKQPSLNNNHLTTTANLNPAKPNNIAMFIAKPLTK